MSGSGGNNNGSNGLSNGTWDMPPPSSASSSKRARVDYVKSFIKTSNGTFLPAPSNSVVASSSSSSGIMSSATTTISSTSASHMNGSDSSNGIMSVSENVVAVTQLKEKILSLDRQLKLKNQELLKKDVKVSGATLPTIELVLIHNFSTQIR